MNIPEYLAREKGVILSEQQLCAAGALDGVILLLAVPGAGKTTVLSARTAELVANRKVPPEQILTITFSRESARDMARRWEGLFGGLGLPRPAFSTIHSFCYGLLREYAALRGTSLPRLLEGDGREGKGRILTELYRRRTGQFLSEDRLSDLENAMGYCVNMRLTAREAGRAAAHVEGFREIFEEYTAYKRANHLMDFDDMLLFACTALERSAPLRERFSRRYSYIQVDEAQDTSKIQHQILEKICRGNLFLVGDEDQSIYGFRGAWPQGLTEFLSRWPEGRILKLETNYRSTGAIVESAGRLIESNRCRHPKAMRTPRERGREPVIHTDLDIEEEYTRVADTLSALKPGESCAVLYRTTHSGLLLGEILRERGIPFFSRESRLGWSGDAIVRDISGLMRFACDPADKQLFRQLYFKLGCAIPKSAAEEALSYAKGDILAWMVDELEWPSKNTGRLGYTRRVLAAMRAKAPVAQLDDIIGKLEYLRTLDKRGMGGYPFNGYAQRLAVIRGLAARCGDTGEFLGRLTAMEKLLASPEPSAVTLSTVHSAKGQEFDRVILLDALDGIFPTAEAIEEAALDNHQPMEEETRLFYTAMTRARNLLEIYAPASGMGRPLDPSRFLGSLTGEDTRGAFPGRQVTHAYFGAGKILKINPDRGTFTVEFRSAGIKTFAMASLSDPRIFQVI